MVPKKALSLSMSVLFDTNKPHFFGCAFDQSLTLFTSCHAHCFGLKARNSSDSHAILFTQHASMHKQNQYPTHIMLRNTLDI